MTLTCGEASFGAGIAKAIQRTKWLEWWKCGVSLCPFLARKGSERNGGVKK